MPPACIFQVDRLCLRERGQHQRAAAFLKLSTRRVRLLRGSWGELHGPHTVIRLKEPSIRYTLKACARRSGLHLPGGRPGAQVELNATGMEEEGMEEDADETEDDRAAAGG